MRAWLALLILVSGCIRDLTRVKRPELVEAKPAFLGEASGIYRIVDTNDRTAAIEGSGLLFSQANEFFSIANESAVQSEGSALLSFGGALTTTDSCARGRFSLDAPGVGLLDAPAALHLGLGAATVVLLAPPELQALLRCPAYVSADAIAGGAVDTTGLTPAERACLGESEPGFVAPASICAFRVRRECDFDSSLSGVYEVDVQLEESTGTCTAPSLAGKREWLLTTANGASEMAVLGVNPDGTALEVGILASWDAAIGRVSASRFLPLDGKVWNQTVSKLTGTIHADANTLRFDEVELVRSLDGCTERYSAQGTRLRGSKIGSSCPAYSRFSCPLAIAQCPAVDPALGGDLSLGPVRSASSNGCPIFECAVTFKGMTLCDEASRIVANDGCKPSGGVAKNVVLSKGANGRDSCVTVSCEDAPECATDGSDDLPITNGLACAESGTIRIQKTQGRCLRVGCSSSPKSLCPSEVACTQFRAQDRGEALQSADECPHNLCELASSTLSLTPQQKSLMRTSRFAVTSLSRVGTSDTFTVELRQEPNNGCAQVDLDVQTFSCPDRGTYDASHDVCSATGQGIPITPGLYRSGSGALCIGAVSLSNHRLVSMPASCPGSTVPCCNTQLAPDGSIPLACTPPASPSVMVSVDVTNNVPYPVSFEMSSAPSPVNHIEYLAPPGNSTLIMPRTVTHRTGYTLKVTAPQQNCLIDDTVIQRPFSSESDVMTVICKP